MNKVLSHLAIKYNILFASSKRVIFCLPTVLFSQFSGKAREILFSSILILFFPFLLPKLHKLLCVPAERLYKPTSVQQGYLCVFPFVAGEKKKSPENALESTLISVEWFSGPCLIRGAQFKHNSERYLISFAHRSISIYMIKQLIPTCKSWTLE